MQQRFDRRTHEARLIEHHVGFHGRRNVHQMSGHLADAIDHGDGVRIAALLHHRKIDGSLSVDMNDVVLKSVGILELADVRHQHRIVAVHLDRILAGILQIELRVRIDVVVEISDLNVARRKNDVRLTQGPHHVHRTDLPGFQLERIDIELDLTPWSAKRLRNGCAGNARELIANEVLSDVLQIAVRHSFAVHRDQTNGKARSVGLEHHRRQGAGRQVLHIRDGQVGDGRRVNVRIGVGLKIDANDTDAVQRSRFDMIDAAGEA